MWNNGFLTVLCDQMVHELTTDLSIDGRTLSKGSTIFRLTAC
jgi:hypothetical protein